MVENHTHKQFDIVGLATALLDAVNGKQTYAAFATPVSGTLNISASPIQSWGNFLNGNATLAPTGLPALSSTKVSQFYWVFVQDATGGRVLTLDPAIILDGSLPVIDPTPNALTVLRFVSIGTVWTCRSVSLTTAIFDKSERSSGKQPYANFGGTAVSGIISFTAQPLGSYVNALNGAASIAPAGMPPVSSGRSAHWYWRVHQDATGGRVLTIDPTIIPMRGTPTPVLNPAASAYTLIHFYYDGQTWWYETSRTAPLGNRVFTTASLGSLPFGVDDYDAATITALAVPITFGAPTGTPVNMQSITFRIKDNGTARAITWNAAFRAFGAALPTTTVINKTLYVVAQWNSTDSKWDAVRVIQEV